MSQLDPTFSGGRVGVSLRKVELCNIRIRINPPFDHLGLLQRRDPFLGQHGVSRHTEIPGVAYTGDGFEIKPDPVDIHLIGDDDVHQLGDLLLDGFTGLLVRLCPRAREHVCVNVQEAGFFGGLVG